MKAFLASYFLVKWILPVLLFENRSIQHLFLRYLAHLLLFQLSLMYVTVSQDHKRKRLKSHVLLLVLCKQKMEFQTVL